MTFTINSLLPWLVLLLPLTSAGVISLFTRRWKNISSAISVAAVLGSFVCSCLIFGKDDISAADLTWIDIRGVFNVPFAFILDDLSRLMLLVVSGVGSLIHIYSLGYMRDDDGKSRYFAALSLFMFAMLGIVLASNFVMMFIFWELVGFTSYVLIGHWFERDSAADAAKKAFLTTRVGDFGFMIGILMVWMATGSVVFDDIVAHLSKITSNPGYLTIAALLIFCGAVGKSAQFPLHVWLPDAMEGPTPVSALIHAATMVAAGVYLLVRVAFLIQASQTALLVIAWIGTITALLGAVMVLFLAAGSVIVSLHHEQNIWRMGGLAQKLKITFATFAVGALALIGCPPFSGFFSKDAILALAYERNMSIFVIGLTTAFLTAFYVSRAVIAVFFGKPRGDAARTGKESPLVMIIPLLVLALFALIAGLESVAQNFLVVPHEKETISTVPALALVALILGVGIAVWLYRNRERDPLHVDLVRRRFYIDEFYEWMIGATQELLARVAAFFDRWIIDAGAVRGASGGTFGLGALLRLFQVGNLQAYAFLFGLGIVALIYFTIFR